MALLVQPNYDDRYENAAGYWADEMSEAFYIAIKDALHDELRDEIKIAAATSLAYNFYSTGDCKLCEAYGLTNAHAACYLNEVHGNYQKEVEQEFDEYLSNRF